MALKTGDHPTRILILGCGVLGGGVLDFLSQSGRDYDIHVAAREIQKVSLRANLARYTAANLGHHTRIEVAAVDLMNVEATAAYLAGLQPDIIFNATTLHSWWVITQLPQAAFQRLDQARGGVWAAMHLVLVRRLMQAVRMAGIQAKVVNASYPDVVNAALAAEGSAPMIGIGNIANAVPGIQLAAAHLLGCDVKRIAVRFFAHHYLSYRMPSTGGTDGAPYHLTFYRDGEELPADALDHGEVFTTIAGRFRRVKGLAGQSVTASSATAVLRTLADGIERVVHAPGPLGLVGGYPVRLSPDGASIELPQGLSLQQAVAINRACQKFDGIEDVDSDGTIRFTADSAAIIREEIGFDCPAVRLVDCEETAKELSAKFAAYRHGQLAKSDLTAA
ncbi:saccharopine dehydrogenase NADP-binding domain-containing protein [Mesorhizobium retamae]|uniref:saccharopine dehydrogenase NADP-binding domain-containing protein n=1 Tax=Mesorhizobium retamae TaxID=2912854 RepID=UPI0023B83521|nr:saccharopine dehydrogenase NADP-binding domain-containing protein [Mesorhizobium sp. IRAMC:0171]